MKALLSNTVQVFSDQAQLVQSFDVLPIASWSATRSAEYPNVPTMKELGYDYDIYNWVGAYAPKGVPPSVMEKLISSFKKTMQDPAVLDGLKKMKIQVSYMGPKDFGEFTVIESNRNRKLLQAADLLAK